jgi:hypothetical protein
MDDLKTGFDYYNYFKLRFEILSTTELIELFNKTVGIRAYGIPRQGYLWALREQIIQRGIDCSEIYDRKSMSFANQVDLVDNKLVVRKSDNKDAKLIK